MNRILSMYSVFLCFQCHDCLIHKPALKCLSALTRSFHKVRLLTVESKGKFESRAYDKS